MLWLCGTFTQEMRGQAAPARVGLRDWEQREREAKSEERCIRHNFQRALKHTLMPNNQKGHWGLC